jgi:hypothetical protein
MKNDPYPFCMWMKNDPYAFRAMDEKGSISIMDEK